MITPVFQSFGVFLSFLVTLHTLVNQRASPFNAFNILSCILSSPAAFPDFNPRMASVTSVNVTTYSSFPKINRITCVSGCCSKWVNKSKSILSTWKVVVLKLFRCKRQMVCQNPLFADKKLESSWQPNSTQERSLDIFTARAAAFWVSEYRDCKSDDDLFCKKALKASFFDRIASLIS